MTSRRASTTSSILCQMNINEYNHAKSLWLKFTHDSLIRFMCFMFKSYMIHIVWMIFKKCVCVWRFQSPYFPHSMWEDDCEWQIQEVYKPWIFVSCGKPNDKPSPFIIVSRLIHVMIFGIGCSTLFSMYPIYRNQIEWECLLVKSRLIPHPCPMSPQNLCSPGVEPITTARDRTCLGRADV